MDSNLEAADDQTFRLLCGEAGLVEVALPRGGGEGQQPTYSRSSVWKKGEAHNARIDIILLNSAAHRLPGVSLYVPPLFRRNFGGGENIRGGKILAATFEFSLPHKRKVACKTKTRKRKISEKSKGEKYSGGGNNMDFPVLRRPIPHATLFLGVRC